MFSKSRARAGVHCLGVAFGFLIALSFSPTVSISVAAARDRTRPVISGVAASAITASGATVNWTTNEASDSQVDYGLTTAYGSSSPQNNSDVTFHQIALSGMAANTTYHYRVRSRDPAGNLALSGDFTFTTLSAIDVTAPVVSISAPSGGATVSGAVQVSATASDNVGVAGVQFRLDGAPLGAEDVTAPYALTWDTTTAANGSHTLTAVARDAATNQTSSAARSVTVTNSSATSLVAAYGFNEGSGSMAADGTINNHAATVSGTSWSTSCKFGNCLAFNGTTSFVETPDVDDLTLGVNATFEAWVVLTAAPTDVASVVNKWTQIVDDEYLFGVNPDRTLIFKWHTTGGDVYPSPAWNTLTSVGAIALNTLTHIAVVRSGTTVTFYINGAPEAPRAVADANPFRNGPSTLRVGGQDRGGLTRFFAGRIDEIRLYNQALTQAQLQIDMTTPISPDVTPPVITAISASGVTSSGATINWTTNEASDSQVDYGLTTAYGSTSPPNGSFVTTHAVILGALAGNISYHVRVRSKDAAGNLALSPDLVFATIAVDSTLPVVSITAPASGATVSGMTTFSATATDNVGLAGVEFKRDGVLIAPEDTGAPYSVPWNTTTATAGTHTLTAVAWDAAGNSATATRTVTVSNPLATVNLAWNANTEADLAGYKVYVGTSSGVYTTTYTVGNVTSYTVTGLAPGNVYYFAVTAYDLTALESPVSNEVSATK